jgi:hypothetical protein
MEMYWIINMEITNNLLTITDDNVHMEVDVSYSNYQTTPRDTSRCITCNPVHLIRPRKGTSWVWQHFKKFDKTHHVGMEQFAVCMVCYDQNFQKQESTGETTLDEIAIATSSSVKYGHQSTDKLERHMDTHHRQLSVQSQKRELDEKDSSQQSSSKRARSNNFLDTVVVWTLKSYSPLDACEQESFRAMLKWGNCPTCEHPVVSRDQVLGRVRNLSVKAQHLIKKELKDKYISITFDHWTSTPQENYLGATAHYINDKWKLCSLTLCCKRHEGTSTELDLVNELRELCNMYEIDMDKHLVCVVSDTAANMNAFGRHIRENFKINWHGCLCHLLELTTGVAFKDASCGKYNVGTMARCHRLVDFFRQSPINTEKLKAIEKYASIEELKLIQDVSTRWWSTYAMVERIIKLQSPLKRMEDLGDLRNDIILSDTEWTFLTQLLYILEPFMEKQKKLEGEHYVTISQVPTTINELRKHLSECIVLYDQHDMAKQIASEMLAQFNKAWGDDITVPILHQHEHEGERRRAIGIPRLAIFASFLDVRCKNCWYLEEDVEFTEMQDMLVAWILEETNIGQRTEAPCSTNFSQCQFMEKEDKTKRRPVQADNSLRSRLYSEIVTYRDTVQIMPSCVEDPTTNEIVYNNPLDWWERNSTHFPLLSEAARRILCIPASSAPSERVFSSAGLTITQLRNRLTGDNAADIIFVRYCLEYFGDELFE